MRLETSLESVFALDNNNTVHVNLFYRIVSY